MDSYQAKGRAASMRGEEEIRCELWAAQTSLFWTVKEKGETCVASLHTESLRHIVIPRSGIKGHDEVLGIGYLL